MRLQSNRLVIMIQLVFSFARPWFPQWSLRAFGESRLTSDSDVYLKPHYKSCEFALIASSSVSQACWDSSVYVLARHKRSHRLRETETPRRRDRCWSQRTRRLLMQTFLADHRCERTVLHYLPRTNTQNVSSQELPPADDLWMVSVDYSPSLCPLFAKWARTQMSGSRGACCRCALGTLGWQWQYLREALRDVLACGLRLSRDFG